MVALTGREDTVVAECNKCGASTTMMVRIKDLVMWELGKYIQDAMPYLSADERELLISGTCGDCFEKMFGNCEE